MQKIIMILTDGFEEIEAVTVSDVMRRLGFDFVFAALEQPRLRASNGLNIIADTTLDRCSPADFDAVVLPGGMPNAMKLRASSAVIDFLVEMNRRGKIVAAICAAPIVLAKAGLLENRTFTLYPGLDPYLDGKIPSSASVETDGNIVTGKGPGVSFQFASALASALGVSTDPLYSQMFLLSLREKRK